MEKFVIHNQDYHDFCEYKDETYFYCSLENATLYDEDEAIEIAKDLTIIYGDRYVAISEEMAIINDVILK